MKDQALDIFDYQRIYPEELLQYGAQSTVSPTTSTYVDLQRLQNTADPVAQKLMGLGKGIASFFKPETTLDYLGMALPGAKAASKVSAEALKKLSTTDTKKFFDAVTTTKQGNPLQDLEKLRPDIVKASQDSLKPYVNNEGMITLFRAYNIPDNKKILPEKGIASLTKDFGYAANLADRMKTIGISDAFGFPTGETIKRSPLVARYDIPIDRVKYDYETLLNVSNKTMSKAEKNSDLVSMINKEKEVVANLKGIKPSAIYEVPSLEKGYRAIEEGIYGPPSASLKDLRRGFAPTIIALEKFGAGKKPLNIIKEELKNIKRKPPYYLKDFFAGEQKLKDVPEITEIKKELDNLYFDYQKFIGN